MFSFSRALIKTSEKISPLVKNKYKTRILSKERWIEFKKNSESTSDNEAKRNEIQINQENSLLQGSFFNQKILFARDDSEQDETIDLVATNSNSVLEELKSLQKKKKEIKTLHRRIQNLQKEIDSRPNITKFEWETFQSEIVRLNVILLEEKKTNEKLKKEIYDNKGKINELRKNNEEIWKYAKTQVKVAEWQERRTKNFEKKLDSSKEGTRKLNKKIKELKKKNLSLEIAFSERDSHPDITSEQWKEILKQISNSIDNIQVDLMKTKKTFVDNLGNFSEIANYWDSIQKEITCLKEFLWCPLDGSINFENEEKESKIDEKCLNMYHSTNSFEVEKIKLPMTPKNLEDWFKKTIDLIKVFFYERDRNENEKDEETKENLVSSLEEELEEIKNFSIDINRENEKLKQQNSKLLAITMKAEEQSSWQTARDNFHFLLESLREYLPSGHLEDFLEKEINYYTPNLQKRWNAIKKKSGLVSVENGNLWKENENLRKKSDDFEEENQKLRKEVRNLSNQNYRLQGDFADLEEKHKNLLEEKDQKKTTDINKLTRENTEVVNSNSKLSEIIIKKDEEIDRIRKINHSLSNNLAEEKRKGELIQNELEFLRQNEISQEKQLESFRRNEIELERITEKLEEELEKDREIIDRAKAILAFNGLSLTPNLEEKKILGEELRKISENWISRSSSISSLKDKMPKSPFSSLGKNDSYFNPLPKTSEEKNNNSIIFPKLLTAEPSSIFEKQENNLEQLNQDLDREEVNEISDDSGFIDSNVSTLDNQEISEDSNNISCDDFEKLKHERNDLKKQLRIIMTKLKRVETERDRSENQNIKSKKEIEVLDKKTNDYLIGLDDAKKQIKILESKIEALNGDSSEIFENQQFGERNDSDLITEAFIVQKSVQN